MSTVKKARDAAVAEIEAAYKPHFPNVRVRMGSDGGVIVREGERFARIIAVHHGQPLYGTDAALSREAYIEAVTKKIAAFVARRLELDAEQAERGERYRKERLIREAAPDLLAALEAVAGLTGDGPQGEHDEWTEAGAFAHAQQISRSAIAKARGEQS